MPADVSRITVAVAPADFDDWPGLLGLILDCFASMEGRIDPPSSAVRLTPESLALKTAQETLILACDSAGRLAGCAFLDRRGDHAYLGKVAVAATAHRRGIGARLLAEAEAIAQSWGAAWIELQTRVELVENHATFARMGFVECGRTAHEGFARPTSITMRKPLVGHATGASRCHEAGAAGALDRSMS